MAWATKRAGVNEGKVRARWKLGRLLAKIERKQGNRTSLSGFTKLLEHISLTKPTALAAQRIATLPPPDLENVSAAQTYFRAIGLRQPY